MLKESEKLGVKSEELVEGGMVKNRLKEIKKITKGLYLLLLFLFLAPYLFSEPPVRFTYQGNIRERGILVSGVRKMRFTIYNSSYTTTPLWTSPEYNVNITTGVFRVILEPSLNQQDWNQPELYLELEVEGTKLSPREMINPTIFSINTLLHSGKRYTTSSTPPQNPSPGDLWYDTSTNLMKYYNGTNWVSTSGGLPGPHAPTHGPGGTDQITALATHTVYGTLTLAYPSTIEVSSPSVELRISTSVSINGYLNVSSAVSAGWFSGNGYNITNINGSNILDQTIDKSKLSGSGCSQNQILGYDGTKWICLSGSNAEADPWSIHIQDTLQPGSTFYVSSGTINYLKVNNSLLTLGYSVFNSSISIASKLAVPTIEMGSNIIISTASSNYYGGVYVSTNIYINGKIYGDGSEITNIKGDNLGNHIATMTITANYGINVSSINITATGITGLNPLLSIAGSTMVVLNNGNIGIGTGNPQAKVEIIGSEAAGDYTIIYRTGNSISAWIKKK